MIQNVNNYVAVRQNRILRGRRTPEDIRFDLQIRLAEEGLLTRR